MTSLVPEATDNPLLDLLGLAAAGVLFALVWVTGQYVIEWFSKKGKP